MDLTISRIYYLVVIILGAYVFLFATENINQYIKYLLIIEPYMILSALIIKKEAK